MSNSVGALLMPAPPPAFGPVEPGGVAAIIDPAIETLGCFFRAMLEHYCGDAWNSLAPGEELIKRLDIGHDPEELDFNGVDDTPLLAIWRDDDSDTARITDACAQSHTKIHLLYVAAPADEQKLAARAPFLNLFQKVMNIALANQRDPAWIKAGEENNVIARTYGSYVWGHAGIDGWSYRGTKRVPVKVPTGSGTEDYPALLATWVILESTQTDPAAFGSTINGVRVGSEPTSIRFNVTDSSGEVVRQSADIDFPPDP